MRKLVGPIIPIGDSNEDLKRLANLKVLTELVEGLLKDIETVAENANSEEASVKLAGNRARSFSGTSATGTMEAGPYAHTTKSFVNSLMVRLSWTWSIPGTNRNNLKEV